MGFPMIGIIISIGVIISLVSIIGPQGKGCVRIFIVLFSHCVFGLWKRGHGQFKILKLLLEVETP